MAPAHQFNWSCKERSGPAASGGSGCGIKGTSRLTDLRSSRCKSGSHKEEQEDQEQEQDQEQVRWLEKAQPQHKQQHQ